MSASYSYNAKEMIHVFTTQRDGVTKTYKFGEHHVSVNAGKKEEFASWELSNMEGAPSTREAEDDLIYYFTARPDDVGRATLIWLASKEEATAVRKAIREAY
jgi:hypothetical protein